MLLDHFIMTVVAMVFFIPEIAIDMMRAFGPDRLHDNARIFNGTLCDYISVVGFALYLCKDCLQGRSLAKRVLKLQVVENSLQKQASALRCFVRNLFVPIWPLEVLITLVSPSRRLGDILAGTKMVVYDATIDQSKPNIGQIILSFILSYLYMLSLFILTDKFLLH